MADDSAVGAQAWTTVDNAKTQSDTYAQVVAFSSLQTHYLKATNFGFTIPAGATINGITVEIERLGGGGGLDNVQDNAVKLVNGAGTVVGDNKAVVGDWNEGGDVDSYQTYGGAADDWNASLDDTDINDADFGVVITGDITYSGGPPGVAQIDHIRITVEYTEAAAGTNMQVNIGDVWKAVPAMKINIGDAWKEVAGAQINIGDSWKTIF